MEVAVSRLETMNLLGLILRSILERRIADPRRARSARRLSGSIAIRAGGMAVTLDFQGSRVLIEHGAAARPSAEVTGDLKSMLDLMKSSMGLVHSMATGKVRVRGNLILLARLMPILL